MNVFTASQPILVKMTLYFPFPDSLYLFIDLLAVAITFPFNSRGLMVAVISTVMYTCVYWYLTSSTVRTVYLYIVGTINEYGIREYSRCR